VNQVACDRLGYSRDEFAQMTLSQIDSPEYAVLIPDRMEELRIRGRTVFETIHLSRDVGPSRQR